MKITGQRGFVAERDTPKSQDFCTHDDTFSLTITGDLHDLRLLDLGLDKASPFLWDAIQAGKYQMVSLHQCIHRLLNPGTEPGDANEE